MTERANHGGLRPDPGREIIGGPQVNLAPDWPVMIVF